MSAPAASGPLVSRGAEATIRRVDWWGFPALLKDREAKGYRPKALDERLRKERTKTEARLLVEARRVGVRTPILYDLDLVHYRLILEELPGPTLKELLEASAGSADPVLSAVESFGESLGRLHAHGISHGDLTSSNVLFPDGPEHAPALLDFSMGERNGGVESLAIDLHLVEEDFRALHPKGVALFRRFLSGYARGNPDGEKAVRQRAREIKGRIRYA